VRREVQVGTGEESDTLIEMTRMGNGIVGWDLQRAQVVNAAGCSKEEGLFVRKPWWRR
jgi:hypothetical protein